MRGVGRSFRGSGVSDEERKAISERERNELAEKIQLTAETERRMREARTGGRRLLLFDSVLGTSKNSKTGTATMGVRG